MKKENKNVAIDGPAGSGKTTIGKLLSQKLGYRFLDSGLLFRHFAKFYLDFNKNFSNYSPATLNEEQNMSKEELKKLIFSWQKELTNNKEETIYQLEKERELLASHEISNLTSQLSTIPSLREVILNFQRDLTQKKGWVVVGRDITSQVLPQAEIKIFLTASLEARAKRRYEEQKRKEEISLTRVENELLVRDKRDENRLISPLVKTNDSWEIDTTYLSITDSVEKIYSIIFTQSEIDIQTHKKN